MSEKGLAIVRRAYPYPLTEAAAGCRNGDQ